jgi:hypothetical protein
MYPRLVVSTPSEGFKVISSLWLFRREIGVGS